MGVWNSATYLTDLETFIAEIDLSALQGKKVLITGATGLICSAIVDLLLYYNEKYHSDISIYAAARSVEKILKRFPHKETSGLIAVKYDATKPISFSFSVDYIIHGASNASPEKYVSEPIDTILANIFGVNELLSYGKKCNLTKFVYISSSEVYGKLAQSEPISESTYGSVDFLSPRASYPTGKQAAETLCIAYANQHGMDVSIVRPGHIYGPTAQVSDNRISSSFVYQAASGMNLVLKSAGTQIRSYCHCLDCASAILTVLLKGQNKEAYNISNPHSILPIREMAQLIADHAGVLLLLEQPSDANRAIFNPMDNSSLSSTKLEALGWRGLMDADTGFCHTLATLKEIQKEYP